MLAFRFWLCSKCGASSLFGGASCPTGTISRNPTLFFSLLVQYTSAVHRSICQKMAQTLLMGSIRWNLESGIL